MGGAQPAEVEALVTALARAQHVALISHRSPDGDTIGSALALAMALRGLGKSVTLVCADPVPPGLRFLEGWGDYRHTLDAAGEADLLVAVDCADVSQMGALGEEVLRRAADPAGPRLANLDHHRSNTSYGQLNVVDATSASVAEMVYGFFEALGAALTRPAAQALLTGVLNDTHSFQNSNATPHALRVAAALVEAGADAAQINVHLFRARRPQAALLWREALPTLALHDGGRVASLLVTSAALEASGADPRSDTDGMVDFLRDIIGVDLAILLKQNDPASSKASLRTTPAVDAVALAARFGGGGHSRAAGCDIALPPHQALAALLDAYLAVRG